MPIEPDLPARPQAPGVLGSPSRSQQSERHGLFGSRPIAASEAKIRDLESLQEIAEQDLELLVVLQTIGVRHLASVNRTTTRLWIADHARRQGK